MASGDCVMEQMVLRAQEQPCRCWRGNRPSGGYCFPFFSPSVLCSSFSVLRTPRSDSELCNFEGCSQLSPPGCLPELSSLSPTCELIQLWSCSGSAPLWLCGGSGTQLPPPMPPDKGLSQGGCQAIRTFVLPPEFPETPRDGNSFIP